MEIDYPIVGYGTFIYKLNEDKEKIKVLGQCMVHNYIRIFHKELGYWYPFVLPMNGHKFKAVLYEVYSQEYLKQLDYYEGVPDLYSRNKCKVIFDNRLIYAWIYIPSKNTRNIISHKLNKLNPIDKKKIFEKDLWLEYLRNSYPNTLRSYPKLFTPIKE
ncbi:MAG: gamma-glutamylcyclotransferase [Promethearchaeota archaeon]|nr:MAG: gamma-glutamylcyclotransferase [Candidatus Lokiarchaeota archaeon]